MKLKGLYGVLGFLLVIFGMALILRQWPMIMQLCLAVSGPIIAVIGLVMMFYASIKDDR